VLPASQTDAAPALRAERRDQRFLIILLIAMMLFTLLIGWSVLGGALSPVTAYLWMALACLIPVLWFSYGFLKVSDAAQDFGLLLSALGWALAALALLIQYTAARTAATIIASGGIAPAGGTSTGAKVCGIMAALCLLAGAIISFLSWRRGLADTDNFTSDWSSALKSTGDR
jgi:hypothetical protein